MQLFHPLLQQLTRLEIAETDIAKLETLLLGVTDWQGLLNQVELYAISSLMFKHTTEHNLSVPESARLSLTALALRHRAAAAARYQLMQHVSVQFEQHHIRWVALKGLALAPMIYPADGLRPMRDIDILVPREQEELAATVLREMGFDLPAVQPSKFMRGSHQLPNATKQVNGFTISLEVHHDALAQDVPGHLLYEDVQSFVQPVRWREIEFATLGHEQMLHQLCRHLAGVHPGAVLKLINVMDVVLYSERFIQQIDWAMVRRRYSHVINTLKCLDPIAPLSGQLQAKVGGVGDAKLNNLGEIMRPLSLIFNKHNSISTQLGLLFTPSDWWLHLYYNVDPTKSLAMVKIVRHPLTVFCWLSKRLYSRILGG